jgi:hypothetical protein
MSEIQRDYIERLIEQGAQFLRRILRYRQAGELEPALREVDEAVERLLGPLRPVLERMEASSAVSVAGPSVPDRVRMYAALVGEEGLIHHARGDATRAYLRCRRALELFAAATLAGATLGPDDPARIAALSMIADVEELDDRYRDQLRNLAGRGRRPR